MERLYKYIQDIKDNTILSCDEVKQSVSRFESDLLREDLEFKEDKVKRVVTFISNLEHSTGKFKGKPFILEGWQMFIVANLYGFYWKESGLRRFTSSYIEVARKNGKTAFAATLCLFNLIGDGEGNAEVLLAANSKEQAKVAFDITSMFTKNLDPKQELLQAYRSEIKFKTTDSILKVLAADDTKLDGFNASFGLIDEFHAAKTNKVRNVIKSSMGMREQPHLCTITTAGFNKTSPCYFLRTTAKEVLQGVKKDDSMFIIIFTMDITDNWKDPKNWIKSNPNLGVTVREDYIKEQIQQAINTPSDEVGVKTKNLNIWVSSFNYWIDDDVVLKSMQKMDLKDWNKKALYVGVDLSSVTDFTTVSYLLVEDFKYKFITKYYLPEYSLNSAHDKELYATWAKEGYMTLTPGNVVDYNIIMNDIIKVSNTNLVLNVAYDKYNATQFATSCTSEGLSLQQYSQTTANFNIPTKEMERLMLSGMVEINYNPINTYCFSNVTLVSDSNGNCKPDKSSRYQKIDGVVSKLMALGGYLTSGQYEPKIF